jgi:ribosomal protein S18 acetylase RimI-like enzyme
MACHDGRMSFVLRAATIDDVDGLLEMWREAAENAGRPADTRQAVTALLGRDPEALILAERGGELIGSIIAGWDGWRCHLYRLAEDRFKRLGASRADAMVLDDNDLGQNLWQASGYRRQDDWRRWVKSLGY